MPTARQQADHFRRVLEEIAATEDWRLAATALADVERADVTRLCSKLAASLDRLGFPKDASRWETEAWRTPMRLLLDLDGKSEVAISRCIDWVARDSFWYRNIRSPGKLREKWDDLEDQARRQRRGIRSNGRPQSARATAGEDHDRLRALADQARALEAREHQAPGSVSVERPARPPRRQER